MSKTRPDSSRPSFACWLLLSGIRLDPRLGGGNVIVYLRETKPRTTETVKIITVPNRCVFDFEGQISEASLSEFQVEKRRARPEMRHIHMHVHTVTPILTYTPRLNVHIHIQIHIRTNYIHIYIYMCMPGPPRDGAEDAEASEYGAPGEDPTPPATLVEYINNVIV